CVYALLSTFCVAACSPPKSESPSTETAPAAATSVPETPPAALVPPRPHAYATDTLTADLSHLSDRQRDMIAQLVHASQHMDELYWQQAFRDDHEAWLESIDNADTRHYARINYGPWDRLANDRPFMEGFGEKPAGANF